MQDFIPGQRWISDTELQMGLGTVLAAEHRTVTLVFLATGETRIYARQTAPLTRVRFGPGDRVPSHAGWTLEVQSVVERNGLLTYVGTDENGHRAELEEGELDNHIQLNRPTERLFSGQIDQDKWFEIRYQTLLQLNRLAHSDLYGLTGCRTSLIPHQLYIAHEVANRYAPRVLLADEVGLGKTIEAGLILHHQLLSERAGRVLIVVPESLVHQWLVEMLRRFNLYFHIFDEPRCQALEESGGQDNPFDSEQLALCSLEFLTRHPQRFQQALAGEWDLLVVDEAHHLQWSPSQVSPEYAIVEQLAAVTRGVLLLTATPEQLGKAGHFARLRLLDPDRFPDFSAFMAEESRYEPIARAVDALLNEQALDAGTLRTLAETVEEGDNQQLLEALQDTGTGAPEKAAARQELVEHLLDRHGTGRVLFRNTRATVKGFPQRRLSAYPLPLPAAYARCQAEFQATGIADPQQLLCPELLYQSAAGAGDAHWTRIDPRVAWLGEILARLRSCKVLVITASAQTALDLAQELRTGSGIHAAVFHEGLSLVERDRAAAYFADPQAGSQVLLCSEIGSEGRNFQFAHHMILFDLPLDPDLLEQRIGRLDRIGQTEAINIHVPYLEASAQAIMFEWYHAGLGAFEHTCPAAQTVFARVRSALEEALHQVDAGIEDLPALIGTTRTLHGELNAALHRGRDRLLEYSACRPQLANRLRDRALQEDTEASLSNYLEAVFDCFGVDSEEQRDACDLIRPGEHMLTRFPGLPDDGMLITYARDTALANEDVQYVTWEHPLVSTAMDMVLGSELGNTALTSLTCPGVTPGTLLLECLYVLASASSDEVQASRYLPLTTLRVVTVEGRDQHAADPGHDFINRNQVPVATETAREIVRVKAASLHALVGDSERLAQAQAPQIRAAAQRQAEQTLTREINRLKALGRVNPNVRGEEIDYFEQQLQAVTQALDSARLRLDALRVIVAT